MTLKSPSKLLTLAIVVLCALGNDAQAFTIISYNANGSADDVTFGFATNNVGDNYAELAGFRLDGDWEFENVQQFGFSMCTNGGSEDFIARIIDNSNNVVATSTVVGESLMPNCSGYASTTANPEDYTYFTLQEPVTLVSGQSVVVSNPNLSSSNIGFYGTTTNSASIFSSRNCYGVNNSQKITACVSSFQLPFLAINDSTSVDVGTRIIDVDNPLNGSLQPDTEVQFNFSYFFNDVDFGKYDYVTGELTDFTTGLSVTLPKQYISLSGTDTYDFTSTLIEGHLYMWRPLIHSTGTTTPAIYGNSNFFDVVTYSGGFTPFPTPDATTTIPELTLECSDDLVSGSICKVAGYLFVPSADTLNKFSGLWENIKNKRPFGYVTKTIDELSNLDASASSAFTLGNVPFMDSVFTPFRTAVSGILWALFAIYFYQRRLIHLDI